MQTKLRPGDRIPMSWDAYQDLRSEIRGECIDDRVVGRHYGTRPANLEAGPESVTLVPTRPLD